MAVRYVTSASLMLALLVGGCSGLWGDDQMDRYLQRTDRLTLSAGDAKEVNAVTHANHPWPPGVQDRRIYADGARMQRAVERYHRGARPPDPMQEIGIGGTPIGTALPTEPPTTGAGSAPGGAAQLPGGSQGGRGTGLAVPLQGQ
jgi:hypothetical protein